MLIYFVCAVKRDVQDCFFGDGVELNGFQPGIQDQLAGLGACRDEADAGYVLLEGLDGFDHVYNGCAGSYPDKAWVWWEVLLDCLVCGRPFGLFDAVRHGRKWTGGDAGACRICGQKGKGTSESRPACCISTQVCIVINVQ